jgi:hypothetical protein
MRMAFGLVSILVVMAIVLFLYAGPIGADGKSYLSTVAEERKKATEQVNRFGGQTPDGQRANLALTLVEAGDQYRITGLDATSPFVAEYGFQVGDVIVEVGPQPVGGLIIGSEDDLRIYLDDAYARNFQIVVRDAEGTRHTLPKPSRLTPGTPTPPPPPTGDDLPAGTAPVPGDNLRDRVEGLLQNR